MACRLVVVLAIFLPEPITFLVSILISITSIDIVKTAQFIDDDQKIFNTKIFIFALDAFEKSSILEDYSGLLDIFSKQIVKKLSLYNDIDLEVKLEPETKSFFGLFISF